MRISLPSVRVGDNSIRFMNYSFQNGNFTVPNHIEVNTALKELSETKFVIFCNKHNDNGLLVKPVKTEAVLFGTKAQREKIQVSSRIDVAGTAVTFLNSVKLLGVTLDSALTLDRHITQSSTLLQGIAEEP